ncbi:TIGR03118 family protein [Paludisphaera rhizosphaerae]|uniref:TIGR03118 family protein n=1 Tax=Paludisphaera rhizosphaerae TaxID=2711216 RepID=UPI0013EC45CE|nr:TIGR03118 family protein [Paludisphaera rhizosphaerae]
MSARALLRLWVIASATVGFMAVLSASPPPAQADFFVPKNLVSDDSAVNPAVLVDPKLKNAWGVSATATSPFWVSANGSGLSTLYTVNPTTGVPTKSALEVTIPGVGNVTGQVNTPLAGSFNGDAFLFVSRDGTISGWRGALGTTAEVLQTGSTSNDYTGTTAAVVNGHAYLYSANFHTGSIDILKGDIGAPNLTGKFLDPNIPVGYAPFNIQKLGDTLYVTYALQGAGGADVPGAGHGIVSAFDLQGNLLAEVGAGGALNSPWGLAIAPSSLGSFAGDLLVANSGDGRINVFDSTSFAFLGQLPGAGGQPLVIDGLRGLIVGNGGSGGDSASLYFTAGPGGGAHGVFGVIQSVPEPSSVVLMLFGSAVAAWAGRRRLGD